MRCCPRRYLLYCQSLGAGGDVIVRTTTHLFSVNVLIELRLNENCYGCPLCNTIKYSHRRSSCPSCRPFPFWTQGLFRFRQIPAFLPPAEPLITDRLPHTLTQTRTLHGQETFSATFPTFLPPLLCSQRLGTHKTSQRVWTSGELSCHTPSS